MKDYKNLQIKETSSKATIFFNILHMIFGGIVFILALAFVWIALLLLSV